MAYKLSKLLEVLGDGKWHEAEQLKRSMDLTDCEMQEVTEFLGKYDFAEVDSGRSRLKINKDFKRILSQTT